jgi:hypothetical protein
VTNPGPGNVSFSTITIQVNPGLSWVNGSNPPCTPADFSINGGTPGAAAVITGSHMLNGSADPSTNSYSSSFTIQMVENGANQDSCEGGAVPFVVVVS